MRQDKITPDCELDLLWTQKRASEYFNYVGDLSMRTRGMNIKSQAESKNTSSAISGGEAFSSRRSGDEEERQRQ